MTSPNTDYLHERLTQMGVTEPAQYTVRNYYTEVQTSKGWEKRAPGEPGYIECAFQLFEADQEGNIRIYYPSLDGGKIQYKQKGDGGSRWSKDYFITRLRNPVGDRKYNLPKRGGTAPFIPPLLIDKYQRAQDVPVLVITEGAFKAFKASLHGIDCVALTSITHAKDSHTNTLHTEILELIKRCNTRKVIWLVDGDLKRLSKSAQQEPGKDTAPVDLYKRPFDFFNSAQIIKQLLDDYEVEKWFAYPLTDEIEGNPKGLDDLLIALPGREADVAADLFTFSKRGSTTFFNKINISFSTNEVRKLLHLHDVNDFYHSHLERYPQLAKGPFLWNGTTYRYNSEKNNCEVVVPGDARNYFRVGDQYYAYVGVPNKHKQIERQFHRRQRATLVEDHGKNLLQHVPKFQAFCNIPDHTNFQPVINNCFNVYGPFEHAPEEGECDTTLDFIKHIFGRGQVSYRDPDTGQRSKIDEWELGLDYLQLLYTRPTQKLPILCLVSRENATGKSTFATWLKLIFTSNVAIVGNNELKSEFNASWSTKLLVICDETKIDKQEVVERVKALSTAEKIFMNAKGKDHVEIDFFGKFIFLSNNEENFIYASNDDVRYWVRKVPVIERTNVNLVNDLQEEIPAFLNYLQKRTMRTANRHRAWFDPELLKTEALKKVVQFSAPALEKDIRAKLRNMFYDFGVDTIEMSIRDMREEWFKNRFEDNYIEQILKDKMHMETHHFFRVNGEKVETMAQVLAALGTDALRPEHAGQWEKVYSTKRYTYPRWERKYEDNKISVDRVEVKSNGRPFTFRVEDFLTPQELATREVDPENAFVNGLTAQPNGQIEMPIPAPAPAPGTGEDDLPF